MVSGPNAAVSSGFTQQLSADEFFDFFSAYLTRVQGIPLYPQLVEVRGLREGMLIYANTYTLSSTAPLLINFNYLNVDQIISIPSTNSILGPFLLRPDRFAMDNLNVSIPDTGSTIQLVGVAFTALGSFTLIGRRRR